MGRDIKVIWKVYVRGNLTAFSQHCAVCTAVPVLLQHCEVCTAVPVLLQHCAVCTMVPVLLQHCAVCTVVPVLLQHCAVCTAVPVLLPTFRRNCYITIQDRETATNTEPGIPPFVGCLLPSIKYIRSCLFSAGRRF